MRPKNAGTPGSAARERNRSARAAPSRSEAQASTPASTTAVLAVRITARQSAARARCARSAVSTGSEAVPGAAGRDPEEVGDTVGERYAGASWTSTDMAGMCRPPGFGTSIGMTSEPALPPVIGAIADDRDGTPLGTVSAVFLDDVTGEPTWVGLTDGLHASPDVADIALVAPIAGATTAGGRLRLTVPAEAVRTAPHPGTPDRLSPAEEETLRRHYAGAGDHGTAAIAGEGRDTATAAPGAGTTTAAPGRDTAMTRSEERLDVSTVREPWTRAVLRVETVSEEIMVPVTVTRQQARIEYVPLRAGDTAVGDGTPGAGDRGSRSTGWVTLYGERPVVTTEQVPVERVRMTTAWVTEEETVTDRLRREEIALEGDLPGER